MKALFSLLLIGLVAVAGCSRSADMSPVKGSPTTQPGIDGTLQPPTVPDKK